MEKYMNLFLIYAACAAPFGCLAGIGLAHWLEDRQQKRQAKIDDKRCEQWEAYLAEEAKRPARPTSHPIFRGDIKQFIKEEKSL